MQKVLPGTSREALAFIAAHWRILGLMSLLPMLVYAATIWLQLRFSASLYRLLGTMTDGQVPPAFWNSYFRQLGLTMLCSVVGALMMGALFTQIVRYQRLGEFNWLPLSGPVLKATALTAAYAFGMIMLSMAAYLGAAVVVLVPVTIVVALSQSPVLAAILLPLAVIAIVGFLYWFMFRFFVGLPGVALGSVPDFFRDIWPLARGESWGLPLRVMLATLVAYVPLLVIAVAAFVQFASSPENAAIIDALERDEAAGFTFIASLMEGMTPFLILAVILFTPLIWFTSLLLGTAFQRFRARQEAASG